jgi:peptidyl-prolyl cis-trans isomerase D
MIEWIRKHMGWMMWIIVGLVTVTFLFFGIYPSNEGAGRAAKVGGTVITIDEVNRVYRNLSDALKDTLKDQVNDTVAKSLKSQALQELIVNRLLVEEAGRMGLTVSDEELQEAIVRMPSFYLNGKFDKRTYDSILDRVNMSPAQFEAYQREFLLRQKCERLVKDGVLTTEQELAAAYAQKNPRAKPGAFDKERATFAQTYMAEKQRDAMTAFLREAQTRIPVQVDEKTLARL